MTKKNRKFQRFLFDKDIETYERKLFHHQGNVMMISFGLNSM